MRQRDRINLREKMASLRGDIALIAYTTRASVALPERKVVNAVLLVTLPVAVGESPLRVAGGVQLDLAVAALEFDAFVDRDTLATEERLLRHAVWPFERLALELLLLSGLLSGLLPGRLGGLERPGSDALLLLLDIACRRNNASGLAGRVSDGLEHAWPVLEGSYLLWLSGGRALSGGGDALRLALTLCCGALALLKGPVDASLELAFMAHEANDLLERELSEIARHLSCVALAHNLLDSRVQQDGELALVVCARLALQASADGGHGRVVRLGVRLPKSRLDLLH